MPTFGEELKRLMKEKGLVQKQLAEAVGVNQSFISKLTSGENTRLGADVLFKLAKALGVECTHFAGYFDEEPEPPPAPAAEPEAKKVVKKGKKA
jgi:transcriptional regulator with XRE-family HTH domain